ncbi:TraR/DksA C4-type zinc finger protein [Moorellaceae bacterium AZ2]
MDQQKLEYFRRKLLALRAAYEEQRRSFRYGGLGESMQDSIQELSSYDNHPGDLGSELFERSKDLALRDNAVLQLQKIQDALESIREGTYGRCKRCGEEIPLERLEAVPETTLCLECRRAVEKKRTGQNHRPVEEEVVLLPFGGLRDFRMKGEEDDRVIYGGEDTWQELARTTEHASEARTGSYYGPMDLDEDHGYVDPVEGIPYFKGADGMFYEDTGAYINDEGPPREPLVGDEGWDKRED